MAADHQGIYHQHVHRSHRAPTLSTLLPQNGALVSAQVPEATTPIRRGTHCDQLCHRKRRRFKQAEPTAGLPIPQFNDAIEWVDSEAANNNVAIDEAKFQLVLSVAAIHTTTDLLEQVVLDLAQHPEIIRPLRE